MNLNVKNGFILPVIENGKIVYKFFDNNSKTAGTLLHEINALNLIETFNWIEEFNNSDTDDPEEFLIKYKGAIKIGVSGKKVIIASSTTYDLYEVKKIVQSVKELNHILYDVETIYLPSELDGCYSGRRREFLVNAWKNLAENEKTGDFYFYER
ncbi:MAG: hypothetical protein IKM97_03165 [Clostridia bacterium]|nr:hypothetical protein [Clostridia bacterium]